MASFVVRDDRGAREAAGPRPPATIADPGSEARWRLVDSDRDAAWDHLRTHRGALLARYPREEIALHRDRVVVHAADPGEFRRLLEEYLAGTGMDPNRLHFEFLDPDAPLFAG